ncbi:hypothetical protein SAMN04488498_103131 [Mesorhizobium albiziae]|uniref:Uncharacterized protein n=1 Tax=Neomesorhizobium albiziae TaxID=335020 RepID=A0A1I3XC64_9HYPH|nr:HEPN domain-containing protein [Mesorhizobium albiziae]GLS30553.1 hypothetical protein GCM10007937_22610 [Mesorhizobium albiziae]SFK17133.1 hypothetical protein SAMN04488498_103131 [Mesorhizobium albiziae]
MESQPGIGGPVAEMWYACSFIFETNFEKPPIDAPFELASGIFLEPVPKWVVSDDYLLNLLSYSQRERAKEAQIVLSARYEAEALGSPDPSWRGSRPRSIQAVIDEKFFLAATALWLVKPSPLSGQLTCHFDRDLDPQSLRQTSSLYPIRVADVELDNVPTLPDLQRGGDLLQAILSLNRTGSIWTALSLVAKALREGEWTLRFLLQWVAFEALFGPESPSETTFRLSQRIGLFLGESSEERRSIFRQAKDAYSWRSKIVHGVKLHRLTNEKSGKLSEMSEGLLRRSFLKILADKDMVAVLDSGERDSYLDSLAFN